MFPDYTYNEIEKMVLSNIARGRYSLADRITRIYVRKVYEKAIMKLSEHELLELISRITGGLGYRGNTLDPVRMSFCGSLIAWPEAIPIGGKVLEIGTGIGRTCYISVRWAKPSLYLTLDNSPEILAIALYRNPIPDYQKALNDDIVKICLCDALKAVNLMRNINFDHIIHDGGPNPQKNPRLFSHGFIKSLYVLLKDGGTLSLFVGKHKRWQDRLFMLLKGLGFKVQSVSFPDSPVLIFHAIKVP